MGGELPCRASFVGYGCGDEAAAYADFVERMAQIGVHLVPEAPGVERREALVLVDCDALRCYR